MTILDKKIIEKSARIFFSGTILSRITGLIRDVVTAYAFGSHAAVAALMIAFRFSSLLRRLFGEGALHAAFVPAYEKIRIRSEVEATHFFVDLSTLLAIFLIGIIIVVECSLGCILSFCLLKPDTYQVVLLTLILMPTIFFICQAAFCSSLLQCHNYFFMPSVSPTVFNLFWILGVYFLKTQPIDEAVYNLSLWLLVGVVIQLLVLVPQSYDCLKKHFEEYLFFNKAKLKSSFRNVAKPLGLGLIGVSTTQINSALDSIFARVACLEGPAYLWYAIRIEQVPLALFGVAMAGAILPPLSRAFSRGRQEFVELVDYSLSRATGLLAPCSIALIFVGAAIVNLFYGRGEFSLFAAYETTYCLWGYAFGLLPQGFILILGPAFYVQNSYYRTTQASFIALLLNAFLNFIFAFILHIPSWGIAVATSISSWFQAFYLFYYLTKETSFGSYRELKRSFFSVLGIASISALLAYVLTVTFNPLSAYRTILVFPRSFQSQITLFLIQTGVFLVFLLSFAKIFKNKELLALAKYIPFVKRNF